MSACFPADTTEAFMICYARAELQQSRDKGKQDLAVKSCFEHRPFIHSI